MDVKTYRALLFSWSKEAKVEIVELISAGIGMAGPVLFATVLGYPALGFAATVGSLAVSSVKVGSSFINHGKKLASALISVVLAAIAAVLSSGHGYLTFGVLILLVSLAALIGGYSRALAVTTTRFVVFLIIILNMVDQTEYRMELIFSILAGAIWTVSVSLVLGIWVHRCFKSSLDVTVKPTSRKIILWRNSIAHLSGWQFPIRLALCLGIAEGLRILWPEHHFYWIAITVVILTQRKIELLPIKTTQRVLGTVIGVIVASLLLATKLPIWGLIISIGLFAGVRPLLKVRNYLVYSATMIPLIILTMEAGKPFQFIILFDRIFATIIGAVLVIVVNLIFSRAMAKTV
ncbi:FUSC family protein [Gottfriedia sp. NPDC057948]|uniref:FUSC family protein n=1 Tax=Gottfriedia sp. NPDC057948 TaxID=3346287 RepID=UPI0036DAD969